MARVLLFGALSDIAGWRAREVQAATLGDLRMRLSNAQPDLGAALEGRGVQVALDRTLTRGDAELAAGTEVAFLPPMSGG